MKLLAIETATEGLSVALLLNGEITERFEVAGREHSTRLPLLVPQLLAEAGLSLRQLDGLVCGIGPGSFAGVRIGVSYVKGLALGLDRPVVGVTSLAMLAQRALIEQPDAVALASIDARMDEVYFGAYRLVGGVAQTLADETVGPASAIAAPAADFYLAIGTGWGAHRAALLATLSTAPLTIVPDALPHAAAAFAIAAPQLAAGQGTDAARLVPAYLRNRVALTKIEQQALRDSRR
ncbi:tRNA (adenosine(37)-N6)-threonylcarbamoyltransferase complex dimerization subunit type 1 TsaB [uncultured Nevskia sp.]|uniref:tRNA (adenosine(37)-N6)-threonylcarbamoyltransferase complex dimerization subunit type 1 TsaB n=1 Tax=uncultured Nevskia sp. TaxID=228950 RepID=UPI0025F2436E|nr:tRNA (adenosine(37)-N6)-threonylcarbamoyltransferase complex dimerization subunit type 1 TsaB [uncultured Nevskia sp.]